MFRIGEFSRIVRVSPRMLRHYEKCGLFIPAEIDRFTGYRLYSAGQIPLLGKIVVLRDMGFSINEIGDVLPNMENFSFMDKVLREKTASVKSAIRAGQQKLDMLMQMSDATRKERNIMVFDVEIKKLLPVKVLSLRGIIPHYKDEGMLWEKLGKYIAENQVECQNNGYSIYYDDEYKESDPDVEIAVPVETLGNNDGDFVYREYPGIPVAATIRFSGPFDGGYDAASEKLAGWMEEHGYSFSGPLRGYVVEPPGEDGDMEKCMTELQAPVEKK